MKNFIIKKINKKQKTIIRDFRGGFNYKIKNNLVITLYNQEIIDKLIIKSFNTKYKRILLMFLNSEEEASESGLLIMLDDLARLKNILLKKYANILSINTLNKLLKQL